MLRGIRRDQGFLGRLLSTDESTFTQSGCINRQNLRNWTPKNPRWVREEENQYRWKIMVWAGIIGDQVVGPHIFEGNLSGQGYLEFLQNTLPRLLENVPVQRKTMWWLQDGAPTHNTAPVTECLNQIFRRRWIERNGPSKWPPRSPDLNPLDFYLWGEVKDLCYHNRPTTREDMIQRIENTFATITPAELQRVQENYAWRLRFVVDKTGGHIEPFLWEKIANNIYFY